jgi:hypothetical protein
MKDEPIWIVNDLGELGVEVGGRCFFLYKGDNIEYEDGAHDDGTPMLYRIVGKREFGETQWPQKWLDAGRCQSRYTEKLIYDPVLSDGRQEDGDWKPLPIKPKESEKAPAAEKEHIEPWVSACAIVENGKISDEIILMKIYGLHCGELDDVSKSIQESVDEGLFEEVKMPNSGGIRFVMENIQHQEDDLPYYSMDLVEGVEIVNCDGIKIEGREQHDPR